MPAHRETVSDARRDDYPTRFATTTMAMHEVS